MAAKRFGASLVNPGINTLIMTGQAGTDSVVVLNVANLGSMPTQINIAYMLGNVVSTITNADYLVYKHELVDNSFFQLKGIAVEAGYSLVVFSATEQVSVIAYGMESSSI